MNPLLPPITQRWWRAIPVAKLGSCVGLAVLDLCGTGDGVTTFGRGNPHMWALALFFPGIHVAG